METRKVVSQTTRWCLRSVCYGKFHKCLNFNHLRRAPVPVEPCSSECWRFSKEKLVPHTAATNQGTTHCDVVTCYPLPARMSRFPRFSPLTLSFFEVRLVCFVNHVTISRKSSEFQTNTKGTLSLQFSLTGANRNYCENQSGAFVY